MVRRWSFMGSSCRGILLNHCTGAYEQIGLTMSLILSGCSTGRSAGLAPLKIHSEEIRLFHLDLGGADDRPPFLRLRFVESGKTLGRLDLAWSDIEPEIREALLDRRL